MVLANIWKQGIQIEVFIDFCVSKVWYKVHTTNEINPYIFTDFAFLGQ